MTNWLFLSVILYFLAHFLRTLKYWLLFGDSHLSFKKLFSVFYLTTALGLILPSLFSETIRLASLIYLTKNTWKTATVYFVHRLHDAFFIGILLTFEIFSDRLWAQRSLGSYSPALILCLVGIPVTVAATFLSLPQILTAIKLFFLSRMHSKGGTAISFIIRKLHNTVDELISAPSRVLLTPLSLTIVIWSLDVLAVWLLMTEKNIVIVAQDWIDQSLFSLNHSVWRRELPQSNFSNIFLFNQMAMPQLFIGLIIITIIFARVLIRLIPRNKKLA